MGQIFGHELVKMKIDFENRLTCNFQIIEYNILVFFKYDLKNKHQICIGHCFKRLMHASY